MQRALILGVASLVLTVTPAFADDEPDSAAAWPHAVIDRPLVLLSGMYAPAAAGEITHLSVGGVSDNEEDLRVGFGYGVTPRITVGAEYVQGSILGPFTLYGLLGAVRTENLAIALGVDATINVNGIVVPGGGSSTTETLGLGVAIRFKLSSQVAIISNSVIAPAPGATPNLAIGLNSGAPITLGIPVGVGLQPTTRVFVWATTALANLSLSNSSTLVLFKDYIPFEVGALLAVGGGLDLGAYVSFPDLEHPADLIQAGVMLRYYGGGHKE